MSQWISVKDRLPEDWTTVLTCDKNREQKVSLVSVNGSDEVFWYAAHNVTHWMPLPNPPSGDEEQS